MSTPSNPNWETGFVPTAAQWNAEFALKVDYPATYGQGGTGITSVPLAGQIPIGTGSGYSLSTLTAGSNITITNSAGGITIASSGSMVYPGAGIAVSTGSAWGTSLSSTAPAFTTSVTSPLHVITSNSVNTTIQGSASATATTYTLPPSAPGTNGYVLSSTTAGIMSWVANGSGGSGTVTSITAGTGLSGGTITTSGTIAIANTAVTAGSYTLSNITVNAQGQITAASSTSTTGSGNVVLATSPTLVTPALGTPSSGVVTNLTGTASININGTVGATTPATGAFTTVSASTGITSPLYQPLTTATTTGTTITPTAGATNQYNVTALASAATIAAPSGTPVDGQKLTIRFKDNGTARALTWTTTSGGYRAVGVTLPTTTVISSVLYVGCIYNSQDSFWDVIAVAQQ